MAYSLSGSNGFEICPFIPDASALMTSSENTLAVIARLMAVFASYLHKERSAAVAVYPSMTGIWISIRTS